MNIDALITQALAQGATDIHLEPGLPAAYRIDGTLRSVGGPLDGDVIERIAKRFLAQVEKGSASDFAERGSADLSATVAGVRCRFNVMRTARGVGVAIRVLHDLQPTLESLNLHPELANLVDDPHGLVLLCGPTGSGKSSTLAALVHEINVRRAAHVLAIEQPIEYSYRPRKAFIRQREVERDTPSYDQALRDALREDPDVIVVGEMRRPSTMQLTLAAAETGHLVFTTMHSSHSAEALQRIVTAMPAEMQSNVRAQLADSLRAVVSQRLVYRADLGIRVPELEILRMTTAARSLVRQGQYFKLQLVLDTGRKDGSWSFERYRDWLSEKVDWDLPKASAESVDEIGAFEPIDDFALEGLEEPSDDEVDEIVAKEIEAGGSVPDSNVIVVEPPDGSLSDILSELRDDPDSRG